MSGISRLAVAETQEAKPAKKKAMDNLSPRIKNDTSVETAYPKTKKK